MGEDVGVVPEEEATSVRWRRWRGGAADAVYWTAPCWSLLLLYALLLLQQPV